MCVFSYICVWCVDCCFYHKSSLLSAQALMARPHLSIIEEYRATMKIISFALGQPCHCPGTTEVSVNEIWLNCQTTSNMRHHIGDITTYQIWSEWLWGLAWSIMLQVNTMRSKHNGRYFTDDIFKLVFLFGPVYNKPALVQFKTWHRTGDKPNHRRLVYERIYASPGLNVLITTVQYESSVN